MCALRVVARPTNLLMYLDTLEKNNKLPEFSRKFRGDIQQRRKTPWSPGVKEKMVFFDQVEYHFGSIDLE